MSPNTSEYISAVLGFLCPNTAHPLGLSDEYISRQLSYAEDLAAQGSDNEGATIAVRMAAMEGAYNHKNLSIYSADSTPQDI